MLRASATTRPLLAAPSAPRLRSRRPHAGAAAAPAEAAAEVAVAEDAWLSASLAACAPPDSAAASVSAHRAASRAALHGARLPTGRDEAWRVTDLSPLTQAPLGFPSASAEQRAAAAAWAEAAHPFGAAGEGREEPLTVTLVDGLLPPTLPTLPPGCRLLPLSALSAEEAAAAGLLAGGLEAASGAALLRCGGLAAALNGALGGDALVLLLAPGARLRAPLRVLHVSCGAAAPGRTAAAFPRLLLSLGAGAAAELVEEFCGVAPGAPAAALPAAQLAVTDCVLGEGAALAHTRLSLAAGARQPLLLSRAAVAQAARSAYELGEAHVCGPLSRLELRVTQRGPRTRTTLRSLLLAAGAGGGRGAQGELLSGVSLEHPEGSCEQLHKALVAAPAARSAFDGGVRVARGAQRTDARQLSRALLLAPGGRAHAKPSLQIVADDVRCTHGCTVAELAGEELFYFAARGVGPEAAREALTYSFAAEVVDALPHPGLAARARGAVREALREALAAERERRATGAAAAADE